MANPGGALRRLIWLKIIWIIYLGLDSRLGTQKVKIGISPGSLVDESVIKSMLSMETIVDKLDCLFIC